MDQARELRELRKKLDDAELENLVLKELFKKLTHAGRTPRSCKRITELKSNLVLARKHGIRTSALCIRKMQITTKMTQP